MTAVNLLTRVLLHQLDVVYHVKWLATALALIGTPVLATATAGLQKSSR